MGLNKSSQFIRPQLSNNKSFLCSRVGLGQIGLFDMVQATYKLPIHFVVTDGELSLPCTYWWKDSAIEPMTVNYYVPLQAMFQFFTISCQFFSNFLNCLTVHKKCCQPTTRLNQPIIHAWVKLKGMQSTIVISVWKSSYNNWSMLDNATVYVG